MRTLLDGAFGDRFDDADFEHALGGMHALVYEGMDLIGHGSVVMRRMLHAGRALRTGYVEAVAVRADRRRSGIGDAVMAELERFIRGGYELGALGASPAGAALYLSRGWWQWPGATALLGPDGVRATPDEDGGIYVLPVTVELDPGEPLVCDWRDGDPW
jgi:aminoglycoside 2'-N-acetyltransferase I